MISGEQEKYDHTHKIDVSCYWKLQQYTLYSYSVLISKLCDLD